MGNGVRLPPAGSRAPLPGRTPLPVVAAPGSDATRARLPAPLVACALRLLAVTDATGVARSASVRAFSGGWPAR